MDLKIVKQLFPGGHGAAYTLTNNDEPITSHFCSNDGFAHFDLFSHLKTKEVIGEMDFNEFKKIPII